ncbi:MAG TPA: type II CAAX endopeptidase family protein [Anaerolineales bacterium]|nr:type II CAAX endopeptidase family protein [Anaerolineales bacterium]
MNKIVQFPVIRILIAVLFVGVGIAIGQIILNLLRSVLSITDTGIANILAFVLITPIAYFSYALYVRLIEKRELTELSLSNAFREFGLGFLIGFGLFASVILILWLLGLYAVNGFEFILLSLLGALFGAFVSALAQELVFRAVIYRITEEWLGTWWAVSISAILFGLIHLSSAGATIFSTLAVALQAGVILATVYTLTHRIWMALGLHMAWDFANDGVFGVGIAGQSGESLKGLFQASLQGPEVLNGGKFGIEGSLIALVIVLLAGIAILRISMQNGQFIHRQKADQNLSP